MKLINVWCLRMRNTVPPYMSVWLTGNALALINVFALRRARLALEWVTVHEYTSLVFNQATQVILAIPPWVGEMSIGDGLGHR